MFPLTKSIGEFVSGMRYEAVPRDALAMIRNGFADYAGAVILGRDEPIARLMKSFSQMTPGGGEARVCFSTDGVPAGEAALINGAAGHALDYDDIGLAAHPAHPTVVLASAIFAEGEALGKSGPEMICAYVTGYEVWGELAIRDEVAHHVKGWHPTGTFGAIAAGAACARLRGLDATKAAHAIGIAASQAGGIVANYGSMTKPFHAGRAAQSGVTAARLAEAGMTASADAIENEKGFLKAVSPEGNVDLESAPNWHETWWILRHGLGFKLYPVCYGAHRAIDGMLAMIGETPFQAGEVESITLQMGENQVVSLVNHDPQTGLDGKFSGEFAMATAIIAGRVSLAEVTDAFIGRADVRALMKKVTMETDPARDFKAAGEQPGDHLIVELSDGRRLERALTYPRGHPNRPVGADKLWAKFADCTRGALPEASARALFDQLQALDELGSLGELPLIETQTQRRAS
jgi:2-methylcitrate dehydratase PrpD